MSSKADAKALKILSDLSSGLIDKEDARNQLMELGVHRDEADLLIEAEIGEEDDIVEE